MWKELGFRLLRDLNFWNHQHRTLVEYVAADEVDNIRNTPSYPRVGEDRGDSFGAATDAPPDRGSEAPSVTNPHPGTGTSVTD